MRTRSRPQLFVTDRGDGEPVLLITGWTISSAVFDPVAALYLPHVRIVAYDHRGARRSAPWPAPVSMAMLAADAARVLDAFEITSAHIAGLSMGAGVALELAIRMPHRVKSLILLGAGPGGPTAPRPSLRSTAGVLGTVVTDTIRHPTSGRPPRCSPTPTAASIRTRPPPTCPPSHATVLRRG